MDTNIRIEHLWVIRRNLYVPSPNTNAPHFRQWAHSGVLVRLKNEHHYVIEYTKNGNNDQGEALAYRVEYVVTGRGDRYEDIIITKSSDNTSEQWRKQEKGKSIPAHINFDVSRALDVMNEEMNNQYSVNEYNCHRAQEALRQRMEAFETFRNSAICIIQ